MTKKSVLIAAIAALMQLSATLAEPVKGTYPGASTGPSMADLTTATADSRPNASTPVIRTIVVRNGKVVVDKVTRRTVRDLKKTVGGHTTAIDDLKKKVDKLLVESKTSATPSGLTSDEVAQVVADGMSETKTAVGQLVSWQNGVAKSWKSMTARLAANETRSWFALALALMALLLVIFHSGLANTRVGRRLGW